MSTSSSQATSAVGKSRIRQEVEFALTVLTTLAGSQGISDAELTALLDADETQTTKVLGTLIARGFAHKDLLELNWLGPQVLFLSGQASERNALVRASAEVMDELVVQVNENVALLTRLDTRGYRVAIRDHINPSINRLVVPTSGGLHTGGASKVLLAYAPPEIVEEVIATHLHEFVPPTVRTRKAVLALLELIRLNGYYLAKREIHPELFTLSAPIRDSSRRVVGALGVGGSVSGLTEVRRDELLRCLLESVDRIEERLGL
jgi:DNA-binding IclR family transcriptional regulator